MKLDTLLEQSIGDDYGSSVATITELDAKLNWHKNPAYKQMWHQYVDRVLQDGQLDWRDLPPQLIVHSIQVAKDILENVVSSS